MQRGRSCGHRTVARPHRQGSGRSAPRSHAVAWKIGSMKKQILRLHMSSPEIALCVVFKLLPVEPVLVRPHPDSNLLNKMRIFSLSCLFVCSPGCHRSDRAGKDGGNLSQQGSSLHEQSQSFVSHFTSFLFIQLCSNKAQEYLVPGCFLYYIFSKFVSANPPLCFHFAIVFYIFATRLCTNKANPRSALQIPAVFNILYFCNSSLHQPSHSKPHFCAICLWTKVAIVRFSFSQKHSFPLGDVFHTKE